MPVRVLSSQAVVLSDSGLLVHGRLRTTLRGTDRAVIGLLLDHHPEPVKFHDFTLTVWPDGPPSDQPRRTRLNRLRRQLAEVDLALRCRAHVGFTLERSMTAAPESR